MKKRLLALLLVAVMATILVPAAAAATPIKLVVDNKTVTTDVAPQIVNDRTLIPLRVISETIGADVVWDSAKGQATVETAGYKAVFTVDAPKYLLNGVYQALSVPATLIDGRTMVPLRDFFEKIGAKVDYIASPQTVTINYFTTMTGDLTVGGSSTIYPITLAAANYLKTINTGFTPNVTVKDSGDGIKGATAGTYMVGAASRDLTAAEVAGGPLVPIAVANDGIAIIVNPSNPVKNVTKAQAADIFLGKITNWKQLGGPDKSIFVYTRESGSGTRQSILDMLTNKAEITSTATPCNTTGIMVQSVAKDPLAIGYASIGYVDSTVKALTIDGKAATNTTVINKTYPLSRELFLFTKGQAKGNAAKFIDFIRSDYGQTTFVAANDYVKLTAGQ